MLDSDILIYTSFSINLDLLTSNNQIIQDLIFMFDWGSIIIPLVWFGGMLLVYYERHIKEPEDEDPKSKKKNKKKDDKDNKQEQNEHHCKEHGADQKCPNCQKDQKGFRGMIMITTNDKFKI